MTDPFKLTRTPSLKTVTDFRAHCTGLGIELPGEAIIARHTDAGASGSDYCS